MTFELLHMLLDSIYTITCIIEIDCRILVWHATVILYSFKHAIYILGFFRKYDQCSYIYLSRVTTWYLIM